MEGVKLMRKVRFAIKFSIKMIQVGIKRFIYPIYKKRLTDEEIEEYLVNIQQDWAKSTIKYSELDIEVEGKENLVDETCLYVANHQSMLDIPLIIANVNKGVGAIAKMEMKKVPIVSFWMEQLGSVYLDRENSREGLKAILKGVEQLKSGRDMLIFPEGTRNRGGETADFKKGSLKLAIKAEVPVIPITIDGTYKGLEGKPGDLKAKIIFHKPIYTKNLSKEEKGNLAETCENIIKSQL